MTGKELLGLISKASIRPGLMMMEHGSDHRSSQHPFLVDQEEIMAAILFIAPGDL